MNAESAGTRSITVEYELSRPPAIVWRALTEPEIVARWLMETDLRAVVGHRFTFRAQPMPGWDGLVECEVLNVELYHRLSYSWRGGSPERRIDTVVTWTLDETPSHGTRLKLEHSGFTTADSLAFDGLGKGWRGRVRERMEEAITELS
jgi:uncharacterized protein YndB with AHSA1/START domain